MFHARTLTTLLAPAFALTTPLAHASDLRAGLIQASGSDTPAWSVVAAPAMALDVQLQFRYDINIRDDDSGALADSDDDLTLGFSVRRARIDLKRKITDSITGAAQFEFSRSTGDAELLEAYADWEINDSITMRIGQRKVRFLREENVGSKRQLAADSSVVNAVFTQGYSQFVEAGFGADAWKAWIAFSDGFNSRNTAFDSAKEADAAITARAEFKLGDADWKAHNQFTSFRGAPAGGLLGLAGHWQSSGDTNPSDTDLEFWSLTADFGWVGDGWNAFAGAVWRRTESGSTDFDDLGFVVQGGVFVADSTELFARYDLVSPDDDRSPSSGSTSVDDFGTLTVGVNHYLVPESHAAKLTLAASYYFDAVNNTGGVVKPSDGLNLFADTERGQIGITLQLQLLF